MRSTLAIDELSPLRCSDGHPAPFPHSRNRGHHGFDLEHHWLDDHRRLHGEDEDYYSFNEDGSYYWDYPAVVVPNVTVPEYKEWVAYYYYATLDLAGDVLCTTQRTCEETCTLTPGCAGFDWAPLDETGVCVPRKALCAGYVGVKVIRLALSVEDGVGSGRKHHGSVGNFLKRSLTSESVSERLNSLRTY